MTAVTRTLETARRIRKSREFSPPPFDSEGARETFQSMDRESLIDACIYLSESENRLRSELDHAKGVIR